MQSHALERLVASITRFLDPRAALAAAAADGMEFTESQRKCPVRHQREQHSLRGRVSSSKLAAARWISEDVWIDGLGETTDDAAPPSSRISRSARCPSAPAPEHSQPLVFMSTPA